MEQPKTIIVDYNNPIDNLFTKYANMTASFLKANGFNTNGITTLSLVFGVLTLKFVSDKSFKLSLLCYLIFYFLDFVEIEEIKMNGPNNKQSKYSLIKNIAIHSLVAYTIYSSYSTFEGCSSKIYIIITILLISLSLMHQGCQNIQSGEFNNSSLLSKLSIGICPATSKEEATNMMKYTRYFGKSSLVLMVGILIFMEQEYTN